MLGFIMAAHTFDPHGSDDPVTLPALPTDKGGADLASKTIREKLNVYMPGRAWRHAGIAGSRLQIIRPQQASAIHVQLRHIGQGSGSYPDRMACLLRRAPRSRKTCRVAGVLRQPGSSTPGKKGRARPGDRPQ